MSATDIALPVRDFAGGTQLRGLVIPVSASTRPYFDGLEAGRLMLQCCSQCGRFRNPVAPVCPYCRASSFVWKASGARGSVVSWVRYARSYLPQFESLVPYAVLTVELAERVRLFGRLAERDVAPRIGMEVAGIIERWADGGRAVAFVAATEGG